MIEWDVPRSAKLMIAKHGWQAIEHAERLAEQFDFWGDKETSLVWRDVVLKIAEIQAKTVAGKTPPEQTSSSEEEAGDGELPA